MKYPYGKKVLVTGGTSGIGGAIVKAFAEKGYTVYAVSRRVEEKTVFMEDGVVHYKKMDVRDEESIQSVAKEVDQDLAILVHAAGFGIGGAAEDTPMADVREQMETNYFGVLRVNQVFLPRLRQQKQSLVIAISSIGGRVALPYQSHYSSSKYALEAYIEALGIEAKPFGVKTVLVEPGDTKTGFTAMRRCVMPEASPYREAYERAIQEIEKDENGGYSPDKVAKVVLKCAERKNPPVRVAVGFVYKALMVLLRIFPDKLVRFIVTKMYHC